jgi:excisionase family DNA binding protein
LWCAFDRAPAALALDEIERKRAARDEDDRRETEWRGARARRVACRAARGDRVTEFDVRALAAELAPLIAERKASASLLDADQAAEVLNVPASWLLAQARANRIPHHRLGRYLRFRRDELEDWLDRRAK